MLCYKNLQLEKINRRWERRRKVGMRERAGEGDEKTQERVERREGSREDEKEEIGEGTGGRRTMAVTVVLH